MTEILTESFCERCGTRYTFESAAPRKSRLGRVRVVSKGLRNFVMQDESTLSEAMADARSDEERAATAHQLDAFHKTFNFCMSCRQYTCGNCWNTVEGRCLTCSPVPGMELPEATAIETVPGIGDQIVVAEVADAAEVADLSPEAWPEADLGPDRLARAMGLASVAAASGPDVDATAEPAAPADAAGDTGSPVEDAAAGAASVPQVIGLQPGQSLEDALAAYEAQAAAEELAGSEVDAVEVEGVATGLAGSEALETAAAAPEPEIISPSAEAVVAGALVADALEAGVPEPEAQPEPETATGEAQPEPSVEAVEAVAAAAAAVEAPPEPEPEPEAAAAVEARPEPEAGAPAHDDVVVQPTWPVAATSQALPDATPAALPDATPAALPDATPAAQPAPAANPWLTVAPDDGAAPQWPAAAGWARTTSGREAPSTLAGRPLLPRDNAADLWAASAREVLSGGPSPAGPASASAGLPAAPQPCVSCGLSLSVNARFCRRCGARQG